VLKLKAQGQEKREYELDKRLAIIQQTIIGRFILEINSDGPVFTGLASGVAHGSPSGQMVVATDDPR
jgi:hypothetical protein